jgi:hypothetical protein
VGVATQRYYYSKSGRESEHDRCSASGSCLLLLHVAIGTLMKRVTVLEKATLCQMIHDNEAIVLGVANNAMANGHALEVMIFTANRRILASRNRLWQSFYDQSEPLPGC